MKPILRILFIDHSPEDAKLIALELEKEYNPVYERVDSEPALEDALHRGSWEVVISDAAVPKIRRVSALNMVRNHGLDAPFIVISGDEEKDSAVDAVQAGAHYVVKNKLSGLLPAVKRELRESVIRRQRGKVESAFDSSQMMFRSLVEQPLVGVYFCHNNQLVYVNRKCADIFGYRQDEMMSIAFLDLVGREYRDELSQHLDDLKTARCESIQHQFKGVRKNGSILELNAHSTRMTYNGEPAVVGTLLDATERNKLEEESLQSEITVNSVPSNISHYFNNFLTVINGYSSLALRTLDPGSNAYREIETILLAGERAAEQMRQFQDIRTGYHGTLKVSMGEREVDAIPSTPLDEVTARYQRFCSNGGVVER